MKSTNEMSDEEYEKYIKDKAKERWHSASYKKTRQKYYEKNKDTMKENAAQWRKDNLERSKELQKEWRKNNPGYRTKWLLLKTLKENNI